MFENKTKWITQFSIQMTIKCLSRTILVYYQYALAPLAIKLRWSTECRGEGTHPAAAPAVCWLPCTHPSQHRALPGMRQRKKAGFFFLLRFHTSFLLPTTLLYAVQYIRECSEYCLAMHFNFDLLDFSELSIQWLIHRTAKCPLEIHLPLYPAAGRTLTSNELKMILRLQLIKDHHVT